MFNLVFPLVRPYCHAFAAAAASATCTTTSSSSSSSLDDGLQSSSCNGDADDDEEVENDGRSTTGGHHKVLVSRKTRKSLTPGEPKTSKAITAFANACSENEEHQFLETKISGEVKGKVCVLIDDVIDTGRGMKAAVEVVQLISHHASADVLMNCVLWVGPCA